LSEVRTRTPLPLRNPEDVALESKLKWLMFFRVTMISVLLGSSIFFLDGLGEFGDPAQALVLGLIVGTYLLTMGYALLLPRCTRLRLLAHFQLAGDVLTSAALVWATGGSESVFTFLFSLAVIDAAIILYRRGALLTATFAALAFLLIMGLELSPWLWLRPGGGSYLRQDRNLLMVVLIQIGSLYLVATLAGYLAEMLRRAGSQIRAQSMDIRRIRALYEHIVQAMTGGLITVDRGRIILFNPAAERITGLSAAEVLYRPLSDVLPELPPEAEGAHGADSQPAQPPLGHPGELPLEVDFDRSDGERIRLACRWTTLPIPGGAEDGVLLVLDDVTRLRRLETAMARSARLAAVGELAAGIAHELRNPLASMSGAAQLLSAGSTLGEEDRILLDIVRKETERLERLINDFLSYARPPTGQRGPVRLRELAELTQRAFLADPSLVPGTQCELDLPDDLWVAGDADQLRQVIWNLLANAGQALPPGEGRIVLSARRRPRQAPAGRAWVEIAVQDNGCGMSAEVRGRMFDPFFTTRPRGTGLGLAIVHRIVEEHQGILDVQSEPGRGTRVAFTLAEARPSPRPFESEAPA